MAKRKVIKSRANIYWDGGKFLNSLGGNPVDGKLTTGLFKGMSTGTGNLISGIGSAVGKIGGGLIAGGLESGAGNAISSIGSTIGSIIPGPMGGLVSAAAGVVGGLTNKMFGSKLNKENIAKVENNIGQLSSFTSDASSFDSLADNYSSAPTMGYFSRKDIGKDGWFSNKAKNKYKALKKQADLASKWVDNSLLNNAENIENTMAQNLEANYAAFGGPLGGIAIGYELAKQDLANKELAALGRNKITSMPNSFGPISTFAFGGHTHGANFTNGITLIDAGGSHESNPYEGVPMGVDVEGTPNLVEEGEVVWNDYVFSNRIQVPKALRVKHKLKKKGSLTFADAAEILSRESEERPNDPISEAGLNSNLTSLMHGQEEVRNSASKARHKGNKFAFGGFEDDPYWWATPEETSEISNNNGTKIIGTPLVGFNEEMSEPVNSKVTTRSSNGTANGGKKETKYNPLTALRYAPVIGGGLSVLTDALGLTNKPDYSNLGLIDSAVSNIPTRSVRFTPIGNYLTYTPLDREFHTNRMRSSAAAGRRAIANTAGGNRASAVAGILASDFNTLAQYGNLARQAEEFNLAQRQKVEDFNRATNMFNSEGFLKADTTNVSKDLERGKLGVQAAMTKAKMMEDIDAKAGTAKSINLTNFINSLGNIGREEVMKSWINENPALYYAISTGGAGTPYKKRKGGYLTRRK